MTTPALDTPMFFGLRFRVAPGFVYGALLAAFTACQPEKSSAPDVATMAGTSSASTSSSPPPAAPAMPHGANVAATVQSGDASSASVPEWALGTWKAGGVTTVTTLKLPNDQGVQLGWLKDKGTRYVGPVDISFTLARDGAATGKLSGTLGDLLVSGAWPSAGPLHLTLRPVADGPDVFHGTLTIVWDAQKKHGGGQLRATSGDGQWLRSADLEVVGAS